MVGKTLIATLPALFLIACGSSDSGSNGGNAPGPKATPQPPAASATPAPAPVVSPSPEPPAPTPSPEPAPQAGIEAMQLGEGGRATGVNDHEWISIVEQRSNAPVGFTGWMTLPPDAGDNVPSPPDLPCLATLDASEPGACFHEYDMPLTVVNDRILGVRVFFGSGGPFFPFPYLFTDDGEALPLLPEPGEINFPLPRLLTMVLGSGQGIAASLTNVPVSGFEDDPVYWTAPAADAGGTLPNQGFARGPEPTGMDEAERIAARGLEPELPVVYLPGEDGYALVVLPLLEGGEIGAALAIEDGRLVGWSDDANGDSHATIWTQDQGDFVATALPVPEQATRCDYASAIDANRVAGGCFDEEGARITVIWDLMPEPSLGAILAPLASEGDGEEAYVTALAESLAVGWSGFAEEPIPVAWRLPRAR